FSLFTRLSPLDVLSCPYTTLFRSEFQVFEFDIVLLYDGFFEDFTRRSDGPENFLYFIRHQIIRIFIRGEPRDFVDAFIRMFVALTEADVRMIFQHLM